MGGNNFQGQLGLRIVHNRVEKVVIFIIGYHLGSFNNQVIDFLRNSKIV
jgi:hypothetical protein